RNVEVRPGLGYRDLGGERVDWVLCNVPARIGPRAIRYLLESGSALGAEVRAVVIRDLAPVVEGLGIAGLRHVVRGPRHDVYTVPSRPAALDVARSDVYARDETVFEILRLSLPHASS